MADKITKTVDDEVAKKDLNGDGHISQEEMEMDLEFKRKELEDADARRDAMRKMTWFSLLGMLLYPFAVVIANLIGLETTGKILGDIAPTYFVSVALSLWVSLVQMHIQIRRRNNGCRLNKF